MDIITAVYAANKAKADLENSGQVGRMGTQKVEIYPETVLPFTPKGYDEVGAVAASEFTEYPFMLVAGETYVVTFDGITYLCEAITNSNGWVSIGNHTIGFDDYVKTECPFQYQQRTANPGKWCSRLTVDVEGNEHTISIYQETEGVIPIDPKYLPNPADLPSDWIADLKAALGI